MIEIGGERMQVIPFIKIKAKKESVITSIKNGAHYCCRGFFSSLIKVILVKIMFNKVKHLVAVEAVSQASLNTMFNKKLKS